MIKNVLRKLLPAWLTAVKRNCGGINKNTSFFAGQLAKPDINDDEYLKIINALIFENGVRKSTKFNRNSELIRTLIAEKKIGWEKDSLTVLDVGASVGIDALGNLEALKIKYPVKEYVLGDLYTTILYDTANQLIFDEYGNVVQALFSDYFVTMNFEFKYWIEPLYHLYNIYKTKRLKKHFKDAVPAEKQTVIIPLLYKKVMSDNVFKQQKINVFEPLNRKFDLIICMNLLQPRYFKQELIESGNRNLINALNPKGYLITGVTDNYDVISEGSFPSNV